MAQGYEVYIGEIALHDFVLITGVESSILPPRTNYGKEIPSMYGQHYTGFNYDVREVTLTALVEADTQEERNESLYFLADILNYTTPRKIILGSDPDKYFYAVPNTIEQERIGAYNSLVTIKLKCYDVYKYALEDDFFSPDEKNIVTVVNSGSVETYPVTTIEFSKKAYFVQCTNPYGDTILVGTRPSVDKTNGTGDSKVLTDPCESMTNWLPAGNVIESGFEVMGTAQVNAGGYGIMCGDFGSSEKGWHGVALRRNLGQNVENFEATFSLQHNSKGDVKGVGAGTTAPVTSATYEITANPSLRIRKERNTTSTILGKIPKGKVVTVSDIQNNWGKVTYGGVTGYISMAYAKKYTAPVNYTYTIKATANVNVRSGAGTNYKILTTAKKGVSTTTKSLEMSNGWYKVTVNGKTGYTSSKYWEKTATAKTVTRETETPSAENRLGRIEVYGFGQNQERLFRCVLKDSEQWYEYTQPEAYIGTTQVLKDSKACPSPQTKTETDKDGNKTVSKIDSGKFGDWNEFEGYFKVKRITDSKGNQNWTITLDKVSNGKVVKTLKTNTLVNSNFPKVPLNHIVVWFGQYQDEPAVDVMCITDVTVKNLTPVVATENRPIFWGGDELTIDHVENMVYLNGRPFMEELDIGSQFFNVPTGESQFILVSDDSGMDVEVGITKRYL